MSYKENEKINEIVRGEQSLDLRSKIQLYYELGNYIAMELPGDGSLYMDFIYQIKKINSVIEDTLYIDDEELEYTKIFEEANEAIYEVYEEQYPNVKFKGCIDYSDYCEIMECGEPYDFTLITKNINLKGIGECELKSNLYTYDIEEGFSIKLYIYTNDDIFEIRTKKYNNIYKLPEVIRNLSLDKLTKLTKKEIEKLDYQINGILKFDDKGMNAATRKLYYKADKLLQKYYKEQKPPLSKASSEIHTPNTLIKSRNNIIHIDTFYILAEKADFYTLDNKKYDLTIYLDTENENKEEEFSISVYLDDIQIRQVIYKNINELIEALKNLSYNDFINFTEEELMKLSTTQQTPQQRYKKQLLDDLGEEHYRKIFDFDDYDLLDDDDLPY